MGRKHLFKWRFHKRSSQPSTRTQAHTQAHTHTSKPTTIHTHKTIPAYCIGRPYADYAEEYSTHVQYRYISASRQSLYMLAASVVPLPHNNPTVHEPHIALCVCIVVGVLAAQPVDDLSGPSTVFVVVLWGCFVGVKGNMVHPSHPNGCDTQPSFNRSLLFVYL